MGEQGRPVCVKGRPDHAHAHDQDFDLFSLAEQVERHALSGDYQSLLDELFEAYLGVGSALVGENLENSKNGFSLLQKLLEAKPESPIDESVKRLWADVLAAVETSVSRASRGTSLEEVRASFFALTIAMTQAEKLFGHRGRTFHEFYCPMAFDNRGASWLQDSVEIANPYFGSKMLRCGSKKSEYPPIVTSEEASSGGHDHE